MVDPATGRILWGFDSPTVHIHGSGLCADIDPTVPGRECFALDCTSKVPDVRRGPWLWSAAGNLLWYEDPVLPKTYSIDSVQWDADLQREIVRGGRISDYGGAVLAGGIEGSLVLVADVLGDWREELITSVPGELRIYSTTIPANDRRVCLLQDRMYRACTVMNTMGYSTPPTLSCLPEAHWPNLNATLLAGADGALTCQAVVSAPLTATVQGRLAYRPGESGHPTDWDIDLAPGTRQILSFPVYTHAASLVGANAVLRLELTGSARYGAAALPANTPEPIDLVRRPVACTQPVEFAASVPVRLASKPIRTGNRAEAEAFSAQGGGEVRVREDKKGVIDKAISHWDAEGHWLEWQIPVARAGRYRLLMRYCAPHTARRRLAVNSVDLGECRLPGSGGFGDAPGDWEHAWAAPAGQTWEVDLPAGTHTVRLENTDGKGLNLDYLLFQETAE
jgi:hypothetical protein